MWWLFKKKKKEIIRRPKCLCPLAKWKEDLPLLKTNSNFEYNQDYYFIVHFTAGRRERKARDFIKSFLEKKLCTYFIDQHGVIWQQFDGDKCGWHIGKHRWEGKSLAGRCAGVEVACSGRLEKRDDKYYTWYDEEIPAAQVRKVSSKDGYVVSGYYRKYLPVQERALAQLIAWHINKGIPKENILGHDDIAYPPGRKNDPGGSLSMSLRDFVKYRALPFLNDKHIENGSEGNISIGNEQQ